MFKLFNNEIKYIDIFNQNNIFENLNIKHLAIYFIQFFIFMQFLFLCNFYFIQFFIFMQFLFLCNFYFIQFLFLCKFYFNSILFLCKFYFYSIFIFM